MTSRAFYALHDTRTPVAGGRGGDESQRGLQPVRLRAVFERAGWLPHGGLALANSLATALEMAALLVLLRRRLKGLEGSAVWLGVSKALLAAAVMGAVVAGWLRLAGDWPAAVQALGGLLLGAGSYAGMALALKMPEVKSLTGAVLRRLKRSG